MTPKVLTVSRLRRVFRDAVAVDGISFEVGRNEIVGLVLSSIATSSVGLVMLASWFFSRVHRQAVRSGLLARHSAESAA